MVSIIVLAVGGSFLVSALGTRLVRSWAMRHGFVDRPSGHKQHERIVALGGGIAILTGVVVPLLVGVATIRCLGPTLPGWLPAMVLQHAPGIASKLPTVLTLIAALIALHVLGLIDDRRPMGPASKFAVQLVVAVIIAGPVGVRAAEFLPVPLSVAATVFWLVLITNAFNFLDNMDGLSAGVAAVAAAIFALASMRSGQIFVPTLAWLVVGACAGFLLYNFSPATIFMGDAGSLPLGFLMGLLTILTTYYDPAKHLSPVGVAVPLLVLAVPLYDVLSVVIHRRLAGESPLRGDRRHFSHRLVRRGLTTRGAVLTIYLATASTGLPAVLLPTVEWPMAILLIVQCLTGVGIIAILEHVRPDSTPRPSS